MQSTLKTGFFQPSQQNNWFCNNNDFGVLAISGNDSEGFLQGQTTCDFKRLNPETWTMGALCNPKGRVISTFHALATDAGFLLLVPASMLKIIQNRLSMYILRSDVNITDDTAHWQIVGFSASRNKLNEINLPSENGAIVEQDYITLHCHSISGQPPRYLTLYKPESTVNFVEKLTNYGLTRTDLSVWRQHEVLNGAPIITKNVSECFIPQMINLDLLNAISFEKGCYTGQEIIARTQHLGTLKRRMFGLVSLSQTVPEPGTLICSQSRQTQDNAGQVVQSATTGNNIIILAVLQLSAIQLSDLCLADSERSPVSVVASFDPELTLL